MAKAIFFALLSLWLASPGAAAPCDLSARDLAELQASPFRDRLADVKSVPDLKALADSMGTEGERLCEIRQEAKRYIPAADPRDPGRIRTVPETRLPAALNPDDARYSNPDELYRYLSDAERLCVKQRRVEDRWEEANGWKRNSGLG